MIDDRYECLNKAAKAFTLALSENGLSAPQREPPKSDRKIPKSSIGDPATLTTSTRG